MDPKLSPAWIAALLVPVAIMMAVAIIAERRQSRRDRTDGVLMSWDDLRLTPAHLIIGSGSDAQHFPLGGLTAKVTTTAPPGQSDDEVHLTIENAGCDIHRSQPYSYGSSGDAQMFAIKFNSLSGLAGPAVSDRHAA